MSLRILGTLVLNIITDYTAPGLAWDVALKVTKVNLELLSDPDMLLRVEKGIGEEY